jgi:alpha-N-arabinofuranosidase
MGSKDAPYRTRAIFCFLLLFCAGRKCLASEFEATQEASLSVDASPNLARKIPDMLFGMFFEVRRDL